MSGPISECRCSVPDTDDPLGQRCVKGKYEDLQLKYVALMAVALEFSAGHGISTVLIDYMLQHSSPRKILDTLREARSDLKMYKARAEEKINSTIGIPIVEAEPVEVME